jgi:hypothetical protein
LSKTVPVQWFFVIIQSSVSCKQQSCWETFSETPQLSVQAILPLAIVQVQDHKRS